MSKRLVKYSLVAGLTLLLAAPAVAYSQRNAPQGPGFGAGFPGGPQAGRPGRGLQRGAGLSARVLAHADEIGLSAEQRDQILAAQRTAREAQINRRAEAQITALELRDLMGADTRDIAAIEAKLREVSEQRIAGQVAGLRSDEAVRELLSAEQRAALDELRASGRGRGGAPAREPRGPRRNIR